MTDDKEKKIGFTYVDDQDEDLKSKASGIFGLNTGFITKFEFNPNAGKDNAPADAVDISIMIKDREYKSRIYDITGDVYGKDGLVAPDEKGYIALYNKSMKQKMAVIIHTVKVLGVSSNVIKEALGKNSDLTFAEWAKIICSLPKDEAFKKPIDVFLEYQWKIKEGQNMTYLQIPQNMKGGAFLCPHVEPNGAWEAFDEDGELVYRDSKNKEHPFTRAADYMESNKANRQTDKDDDDDVSSMDKSSGVPKKSAW